MGTSTPPRFDLVTLEELHLVVVAYRAYRLHVQRDRSRPDLNRLIVLLQEAIHDRQTRAAVAATNGTHKP